MSDDTSPFGFGRFVPGFDFLQNLARGAAPGASAMPGWVAPTASVQELDRRIQELKTVQFWLEQNARALAATVQALEVQKMTLATLAGMNVAMGDMAAAFSGMGAGSSAGTSAPPPAAAPAAATSPAPQPDAAAPAQSQEGSGERPGLADPLQWWGALTSQFQQIATRALQDTATQQAAFDATREMASGAMKAAGDMAAQWAQPGQEETPEAGAAAKPPQARAPRAAAPTPATAPARKPAAKKRGA